jgi:hypothetical protein
MTVRRVADRGAVVIVATYDEETAHECDAQVRLVDEAVLAGERRGNMSEDRDARVDHYIEGLPQWQRVICSRVREIAHSADPEMGETIKRSVQPYFVLQGNVCALLATKDHVNVFVYDPIAPDPDGIINQGHGNATARAIQIYEGDAINEKALRNLLRAVVANNRQGGWRKVRG